MRMSGNRPQPSARIVPLLNGSGGTECSAPVVAGQLPGRLARGQKVDKTALLDDREPLGRAAFVVPAKGAQAAGQRRVGGDRHLRRAVIAARPAGQAS